MRSWLAPVAALALLVMACPSPFPCTRYCWSHKQYVPDIVDEAGMGEPDGRFDAPCAAPFDQQVLHPPLPPLGFYGAELCVAADVHEVVVRTVASIVDPTIDASQACDVTELEIYAGVVEALAVQARDACVDHLTCKGAPAGCDIDPSRRDDQACTIESAEALCDQVVLGPALAALNDLANGPDAAQPQRDGTVIEYVEDPQDCQPLVEHDTDTMVCDNPGGGSAGVDEGGSTE